jgi:hypothetical protein
MQKQDPAYFSEGRWSIKEIRHFLHKKLDRQVPESTLKRWKKTLGIRADTQYRYTDHDRDLLLSIGRWFKEGGTLQEFLEWQAKLQQGKKTNE